MLTALKSFARLDYPPFLVFLLGLVLLGMAVRAFWIDLSNPMTLAIEGVVITSETRTSYSQHRHNSVAAFEYQYEYRGRTYTSDRYHYKTGSNAEAVKRFRPGQRLTVYIDPEQPSQSIIERGLGWLNYAWLGFGLLLSIASLRLHARMAALDKKSEATSTPPE